MDLSIDFNVAIDLSSDQEDALRADVREDDDDVDLYSDLSVVLLANDQQDVLDYEELSDLSDDELLEEPAGSVPEPAARVIDGDATQELSFSEEDLLEDPGEPLYASSRPSSPAAPTATPPTSPASNTDMNLTEQLACPQQNEAEPVQGCDPAVLHRTIQELEEVIAKLPFRPLQATIDRWRLRTASPSMKEFIQRIRKEMDAEGPSKFFLPWNLRDTINVKKERLLAQGPYMNRKLLIDEYKVKKTRESWSKLDEQHEQ